MYYSQRQDREHWREYLDLEPGYYVLAGIFNALNDNTRATGMWAKGKAPKFRPWPTPQILIEHVKQKAERNTVAGLFRALTGGAVNLPAQGLIEAEE